MELRLSVFQVRLLKYIFFSCGILANCQTIELCLSYIYIYLLSFIYRICPFQQIFPPNISTFHIDFKIVYKKKTKNITNRTLFFRHK